MKNKHDIYEEVRRMVDDVCDNSEFCDWEENVARRLHKFNYTEQEFVVAFMVARTWLRSREDYG